MNRFALLSLILGLVAVPAFGSDTLFSTQTSIETSYCGGGAANVDTTHFGMILRVDPDDIGELVGFEGSQNRCIMFWPDPVLERRLDNFILSANHAGASMSHYIVTTQNCVGAVKEFRGHTALYTAASNLLGLPRVWSGNATVCIIPGECNGAEW